MGVCMAERTVHAQARVAAEAGATILQETFVERIEATGTGAAVHTEGATYRAPVVVVTAGPWAGDLLRGAGIDLPLVPSFEQVTYFALEEPTPLPTVIDWDVDPPRTPYTVPNPEEPGRFKIALHMSGPTVDAGRPFVRPRPRSRAEGDRVRRPAVRAAPPRGRNRHLSVHEHARRGLPPGSARAPSVIGSPCSGHGFKFAPLMGRILADLATAQPAPLPIERFLAGRLPVLTDLRPDRRSGRRSRGYARVDG